MLKLNRRERTLVTGAGILIAVTTGYLFVVSPFLRSRGDIDERLEVSNRLLREYRAILADEEAYQEQLRSRRAEMTGVDRLLLSGNTSSLALAELSNRIRGFADQSGVSITRENRDQSVTVDHHQQINIQLNMSCDVVALRDFLVRVENDPSLLLVQNIEINAPASMRRAYRRGANARNRGVTSENLRVRMTISGFIEADLAPRGESP